METKYTIEDRYNGGKFITFTEPNGLGETLQIEITRVTGEGKHFLGNLWAKEKFINKPVKSYWYVMTYVTDANGDCWWKYNVTTNKTVGYSTTAGGVRDVVELRPTVNFAYIHEATEENMETILERIENRFLWGNDCQNYVVSYMDGTTEYEVYTWTEDDAIVEKQIAENRGYKNVTIKKVTARKGRK